MAVNYAAALVSRENLIHYWEQNLKLYTYNPNSLSPTMLQDYVPELESLTIQNTREFNFLEEQYELQEYNTELTNRLNHLGIIAMKRFSVKELTRIEIQNNNLIRLIIKSIVKIDLLDFIRHFPEAAAILLVQRATEEEQFLPSELSVLFCYASSRCPNAGTPLHKGESCYFKQLYEEYKMLEVEQTIRYDILMHFAVESAETCVLSYFLSQDEQRQRFFKLSLNTYSCINTRAFNHLLGIFEEYSELETFLYTKDQFGLIPMHAAAFLGNIKILKTIMVIQTNLAILTPEGMSILDCVLCSRNPLAVKLVVEELRKYKILNHFLYQLSTSNRISAFFYPLIFKDQKTLNYLCQTVPTDVLFKTNLQGINAIEYATHMPGKEFFETVCQCLSRKERKQMYKLERAQWKSGRDKKTPSSTRSQQFRFSNPEREALDSLRRSLGVCDVLKSAVRLSIELLLYILLLAFPFFIFSAKFKTMPRFIFSQTTVSMGLCFKIVSIALLYRKHEPVGRGIDICRVKYHMYDRLLYCAEGDEIFEKERVKHCGFCKHCSLLGSVHSHIYAECIPPSRVGLMMAEYAIDLFVMLQQILLLGDYDGSTTNARISIQILLSCATIFGTIWMASELLSTTISVYRNSEMLTAAQKADAQAHVVPQAVVETVPNVEPLPIPVPISTANSEVIDGEPPTIKEHM